MILSEYNEEIFEFMSKSNLLNPALEISLLMKATFLAEVISIGFPPDHLTHAGNATGTGARLGLISMEVRKTTAQIPQQAGIIELAIVLDSIGNLRKSPSLI